MGGSGIKPRADDEDRTFNEDRPQARIPETQADIRRTAGIKREVRLVAERVEQPVADHDEPQADGSPRVTFNHFVNTREKASPAEIGEEAVG